MRLSLTWLLAVALVFGGSPSLDWRESGVRVAGHPEDGVPAAGEDALEGCDDNRLGASHTANVQPGASYPCLIALVSIQRSSKEQNPSREDLKIYKLKRAFLI